jgi:hypothetical protein
MCKTTDQRYVTHVEDDDALVLGGILRDSAQMCLQDVVAVQVRHFSVRLNPHLVADEYGRVVRRVSVRTLNFAYWARMSNAEMCSMNLPLLVNLPKHIPRLTRFARATDRPRRMDASET